MIPIKLTITGFLSYRDTVELDFTSFDLACISGPNGAGKSSLLDAFTWALFGEARKRDDSVINLQSNAASVALVFQYEGNVYKVQRSRMRDKTTQLEFQIQNADDKKWKVLTGATLRDTQAHIEHILRLDYETFVNASFFLQGKADQFTQQKSSDRKRILGSIMGLEIWETYRQRVIERRKRAESEITGLDGRAAEINAELAEEETRLERLATLQAELKRLSKTRKAQEAVLEQAHKVAATLAEQRKLVSMLGRQLTAAQTNQAALETRITARLQERLSYEQKVAQAAQIEAAYSNWQALRAELEHWQEVADLFREHETRRQTPRLQIEAEKARLTQELDQLRSTRGSVEAQLSTTGLLETQLEKARQELAQAEEALNQRKGLDIELQFARQRQAEARAENPRLKTEMDTLKARQNQLSAVEGADCPLCGQPLDIYARDQLIEDINKQGTAMGDRYRENVAFLKDADQNVHDIEEQIAELSKMDNIRLVQSQNITRLSGQLELIQKAQKEWEERGAPRMAEVEQTLQAETYAIEPRKALAQIDLELKAIGYDSAAHDVSRRQEASARVAEAEFRGLENARAALQPLMRALEDDQKQMEALTSEIEREQKEYDDAAAHLAAAEAEAPDLDEAERSLHEILEQENSHRMEVGAAQQKVLVLKDLKARLKEITAQREELAQQVGRYRQLDRAFGKDGVPALLIEQALPEIETRANDLLERLSEGNMSVRFVTQAEFKDKKRDDLKETLDIRISDGAGSRDYELYSGGEAFRVNFAIRLALSELLAKRAGARLQTLVIDEGFGSQDTLGRQHLIEAINLVKPDFAKVLVITHIDELKDAFPNRIEVEKTGRGSTIRLV